MIIGIFGGAFDPFHSEHLKIITSAEKELKIDKMIVLPSYAPPHKDTYISPYEARKEMVAAATKDLPYATIDDTEKERDRINPAYEVIPIIMAKYKADKYYYIIGGDSMVNFHTWVHPEIIAKTLPIAVVAREGYDECLDAVRKAEKDYGAEITILRAEGAEVSSSVIKASVELGVKPDNVSEKVLEVIEKYGLYHRYKDIFDKLRAELTERTFNHSVRTALFAIRYCTRLHLNYDKVLLAAALHDCAKNRDESMDGVPKPVVHQYSGAAVAEKEYGVADEEILDAIRYHTSGKPDMTDLGKLIYCADMLEEGRDFPGVDYLREEFDKDLDGGMRACLKSCMDNLIEKGNPIYPLTKECVEYYNKGITSIKGEK